MPRRQDPVAAVYKIKSANRLWIHAYLFLKMSWLFIRNNLDFHFIASPQSQISPLQTVFFCVRNPGILQAGVKQAQAYIEYAGKHGTGIVQKTDRP